jgi:MFS family permease
VRISRPRWLTRGVGGVSLASFFSDSGHEIATSVLPAFLTSVLHASAAALGLIEGIADGVMGIATLAGGPLADDPARRARLARGGYLVLAVFTGAIGLAATAWQAGLLRSLAWAARGLRSPARDSLLASLASEDTFGRAFGLERAGDNLGAVAGPLLAALLVALVGIRHAIFFSVVPSLFAAAAITLAAREARRLRGDTRARQQVRENLGALRDAGIVRALFPVTAFELGNMATTLLILRATQLLHHGGRSLTAAATLAILIYAAHNAFGSGVAYAGGHWIDRTRPRRAFVSGAALYAAAYAMFAAGPHSPILILVAFTLAGSGIGLAETAESALVASLLPDQLRGTGFGLLGGVQAAGAFTSSAIVGLLWATVSPAAGFGYAVAWMALSLLSSAWLRPPGDGGHSWDGH